MCSFQTFFLHQAVILHLPQLILINFSALNLRKAKGDVPQCGFLSADLTFILEHFVLRNAFA